MGALAFLVACEAAPAGFSLCRASCMGNRRRAVRRSGVRPAFCVCALRIVLFLVLWAACDLHISRVFLVACGRAPNLSAHLLRRKILPRAKGATRFRKSAGRGVIVICNSARPSNWPQQMCRQNGGRTTRGVAKRPPRASRALFSNGIACSRGLNNVRRAPGGVWCMPSRVQWVSSSARCTTGGAPNSD